MAGEIQLPVVGNLTADPELRYTQSGKAVVNFTIASTPSKFDRSQNKFVDGEAVFLRCSAWEEFAEHIAGSLTKGNRVIALGELVQRSYETKEGEKRTSMELQVSAIGPELRYATAQVTRTQSNRNQADNQAQRAGQQAAGRPPQGNEGYGPGEATQQRQQQAPSSNAGKGQDVWASSGSYDDETPF